MNSVFTVCVSVCNCVSIYACVCLCVCVCGGGGSNTPPPLWMKASLEVRGGTALLIRNLLSMSSSTDVWSKELTAWSSSTETCSPTGAERIKTHWHRRPRKAK